MLRSKSMRVHMSCAGAVTALSLSIWEMEREFFIDNLLVRIHYIIVMIRWTGLAPWEFEFPFPGSLTSTFLWEMDQSGRTPPPPIQRWRICTAHQGWQLEKVRQPE